MKTDVTYAFISGALFVYVYTTPENKKEKELQEEYTKAVRGILDKKLKGDEKELTEDHSLLGINYNDKVDKSINIIVSRVVRTVCNEFDVDFKLKIKKVEE